MADPLAQVAVMAEPADDERLAVAARALAAELDLPLAGAVDAEVLLVQTRQRLELRVVRGPEGVVGGHAVAADLTQVDTQSGPGRRLSQPLLRAVGIRKGEPYRPSMVDATAGFGEDAWLLAAMECDVRAVERHAVVAALLRDAVRRAANVNPEAAGRLAVVHAEGAAYLRGLAEAERPDVVYLDPMFEAGRKTTERKPMRVLRMLVGHEEDSAELLEAALGAAARRVVVKRARRAPWVGEREPTVSHEGASVRYDVYSTR